MCNGVVARMQSRCAGGGGCNGDVARMQLRCRRGGGGGVGAIGVQLGCSWIVHLWSQVIGKQHARCGSVAPLALQNSSMTWHVGSRQAKAEQHVLQCKGIF